MKKIEAAKKGALNPLPKIIVSSRLGKEENALVVAYCGNCSFAPPMVMVGIVPSRYSYTMIKDSGCFVINIPASDFIEEYNYLGSVSRRDEDKLQVKNIKTQNGDVVDAPLLSDCPVNIECTVVDSIITGSHEMFVGKVEKVHAPAEMVNNDGVIDFSKIQLIK
ncbi:MAG TPA: flavin reductase family protein [Treponemataceae bacterium]|nr:flavin reductase family protein [Treponemataceae bacterium]